ncbi:MAG: cob(I)yrinic acid a,c-diamide adenosyltransferase [Clostridiales bacterium]|nr:cob(I)yrinic acid a,c-diamide adenosyltransferase [Clostridiales bacterium]
MTGPIYTRHGDTGETSLADGTRVRKNDVRVEAYGTIDEANCAIGFARASIQNEPSLTALDAELAFAQNRLFDCSSVLATPHESVSGRVPSITAADTARLETAIDTMTASVGEISRFVLPAGCEPAARLHMARAVIRRAERRVLDLAACEPVEPGVLAFVNRLSDYLFTAARFANHMCENGDCLRTPRPG